MKRADVLFLLFVVSSLIVWSFVSGMDGFKGSNALIVSRSISITATIDGQVENTPPSVGARVNSSDLLVRLHNKRLDQGRLSEFDSESKFLNSQLEITHANQVAIGKLLEKFKRQSSAHAQWMVKDLKLQRVEKETLLAIAQKNQEIKLEQENRAAQLHNKDFTSGVMLNTAQAASEIATHEVALTRSRVSRDVNLLSAIQNNDAFFDNGDASYWNKMVDSLTLRQLENNHTISTLESQLIRITDQAGVERERIGSSIEEIHRAPFEGLINASYISQGTRVTRGTSLLQMLDCSNPVVIVPIPEHRVAEFAVGMSVTIYPINTDKKLGGSIRYIGSGPQIGNDETLLVQDDITVRGVHAVVGFEGNHSNSVPMASCESAHSAIVVIHTRSNISIARNWLASLF